jgi:hypothetical protein
VFPRSEEKTKRLEPFSCFLLVQNVAKRKPNTSQFVNRWPNSRLMWPSQVIMAIPTSVHPCTPTSSFSLSQIHACNHHPPNSIQVSSHLPNAFHVSPDLPASSPPSTISPSKPSWRVPVPTPWSTGMRLVRQCDPASLALSASQDLCWCSSQLRRSAQGFNAPPPATAPPWERGPPLAAGRS